VTGVRLRVRRALVRDLSKPRSFPPRPGLLTTDFAEIRDDPSVSLVADVMGGLLPTERYLRELLAAGKKLVTANKQLLALHGPRLAEAAEVARQPIRFEAAVCGAVPVVRTLCEALPPAAVGRVVGIVNGSCNYVLTRMEEGLELADALAEAQSLGYAEADPGEDVSGADAAAKMALLAAIAFGRRVTLEDVERTGIEHVTRRDVAAARAAGKRLRLVGKAADVDGEIAVRVTLEALPEEAALARVSGPRNEIHLYGGAFGSLALAGLGAGGSATATAVVADLMAIAAGTAVSHVTRLALGRFQDHP